MLYRPYHTLVYARTHTHTQCLRIYVHTIQSHDSLSPLGAPSTKHNALSCLNKFKTQMCGNDTAYFNRPFPYVWCSLQWQRFPVCFHLKFDSIHIHKPQPTLKNHQFRSILLGWLSSFVFVILQNISHSKAFNLKGKTKRCM